ncbi:hypothetical protein M422DRAFT_776209 [Sphaerobolus stellatus SS14]|nr:hypothetical protein M422DRAFT_776209 [Sphaerobolus stellatus SS14]
MSHIDKDSRDQRSPGAGHLRKNRSTLTGPPRVGASDAPPPARHGRSHSFFSFSSKKSAQEQAQQAMETVQQPAPVATEPNDSQTPTLSKRPSLDDGSGLNTSPIIQREIKSVVDLALAHSHKIYFAGPLVRRIERLPDGNKPGKDDGWIDVWAQLGGTTLSVWDMKAIEEASKRGEEVPPSYINITDSFVQVLGALTSPATPTSPAKRYTNVITINTAGSNLIFFACPSSAALVSWASAIRLASWEKSRLEEIYTGHLLRMSLSDGGPWREPATTLVKGRLEGEVKVRIAGHTDWKPMWMILQMQPDTSANDNRPVSPVVSVKSKNRMSTLFTRSNSTASIAAPAGPLVPVISFYQSQKLKDRKKPVLSMRYISQAFAVYPERPEVIQRSTLIKLEGILGEELSGPMKGKESWLMIMPETQQPYPVLELIKWLIAIHDLFGLYGRRQQYVWDPLQPVSMWFAYPVGPQRGQLFLDRETAERLDPRDDRTSAIRKELRELLVAKLFGSEPAAAQGGRPTLSPLNTPGSQQNTSSPPLSPNREQSNGVHQLPPLNFDSHPPTRVPEEQGRASPTPILLRPGGLSPHSPQVPQPPLYQSPSQQQQQPRMSQEYQRPAGHTRSESVGLTGVPEERSNVSPNQGQQSPQSSNGRPQAPVRQASGSITETAGRQLSRDSFERPQLSSPLTTSSQPKSPLAAESLGSAISRPELKPSETSYMTAQAITSGPQTPESTSPPRNIYSSPLSGSTSPSIAPVMDSHRSPSPPFHQRSRSPPTSPFAQQRPGIMASPTRSVTSPLSKSSFSPSRNQVSQRAPSPPSKEESEEDLPAQSDLPPPRLVSPHQIDRGTSDVSDLANEASVLFLLQQQQEAIAQQPQQEQLATWHSDSESDGPEENPPPRRASPGPASRLPPAASSSYSNQPESAYGISSRIGVGRRPSGARAKPAPTTHRHAQEASSGDNLSSSIQSIPTPTSTAMPILEEPSLLPYDDNADALAALSFLDRNEEPPPQPAPKAPSASQRQDDRDEDRDEESQSSANGGPQYRSSFAPSRQAAERKAKALAQQEATYAATHLPGKPKGVNRTQNQRKPRGAWAESSEEEEEEEEEEDDDDASDEEKKPQQQQPPQPQVKQPQPLHAHDPRASVYPSAQPGAQGPVFDVYGQRVGRTLPQPPSRGESHESRVPSVHQEERYRQQPVSDEPRSQAYNAHVAARQSVWSTVLDPRPPPSQNGRDTFVRIDESDTMTKPFQPQGLLSAGLADKEDRSAKRQEELARESGASLINVPNKPPPPQSGLLGAITAHERERKREGGVGAALTERERERRLAEERQRKLDEMQRQQLDQMSQGGGYDQFGQQQGYQGYMPGFDPRMSMNPMMLNPYMAGGFPMMQFSQQQMMAAQMAAQQAYQQAMMTFSQAGGSQLGDNSPQNNGTPSHMGGGSPAGTPSPMMGMDPRMSMGMNPWMGMGMGMGGMPPMNPMAMNPMGMMDPRMSMVQQQMGQQQMGQQQMGQQSPYPQQRPDSSPQGQGRPSFQASPSPRGSSPAPQRSSNNSPRPPPA